MAGIKHLAGTPWHEGFLAREEGDPRRHRIWCIHYSKENDYCTKRVMRCMGSAHCDHYQKDPAFDDIELPLQQYDDDGIVPFEGVRKIKLSSISLGTTKMVQPSPKNIKQILDYYEEHRELDKPILISYCDGKYILERRYARYYVATQLGLTYVAARMDSGPNASIEEQLRTLGSIVQHKVFGKGVVVAVSPKTISIRFADGNTKAFLTEDCIKNKLLKPQQAINNQKHD